jgi:hypothetical protein
MIIVEWAEYHLHASFRTEEYHLHVSFRIKKSPLPDVGQSNSSDLSRQSAVPSHFLVREMQVWSLHSNSLPEHLGAEIKVPNHAHCKKSTKKWNQFVCSLTAEFLYIYGTMNAKFSED